MPKGCDMTPPHPTTAKPARRKATSKLSRLHKPEHMSLEEWQIRRQREAARALRAGYRPTAGEVYLRYGARREVCFCPPAKAPPKLAQLAAEYFTRNGVLKPDAAAGFDVFLAAATEIDPSLGCGDD